jgi:serine/threonine protein kinase
LTRIESFAFYESSLESLLIPSRILFIASDAVDLALHLSLVDRDSCPEFDRWLQLKRSGIAIDFRRIQRVSFGLQYLRDYLVDLSGFEEKFIIAESQEVPNQIYDRVEDDCLFIVKSIALRDTLEQSQLEQEIEKLINLRHPCIACSIGFVLSIKSVSRPELKICRFYSEGCSLAEVLSVNPVWWTSTVKAKVIAGIVLGLRFAHSLGLLHGHLTTSNIIFDFEHCIQIVDFKPKLFEFVESKSEEKRQLGGFLGEEWTPERDIQAFASILFEIIVGRPLSGNISIPWNIPRFVSEIIKAGLKSKSENKYSFNNIFDILKQNMFRMANDVNSAEVWAFVNWVESSEHPEE